MSKIGKFSSRDLRKLQENLNKVKNEDIEKFLDSCAKELAARLLGKVIKRTPVGQYPSSTGKKGGTLRRGWTSSSHEEAQSGGGVNGKAYADSLTINHNGNLLTIEIVNPVNYASYVEYGHRTANHEGWVNGRFMMTISEQEIQNIAPHVLETKVRKFLGEVMG